MRNRTSKQQHDCGNQGPLPLSRREMLSRSALGFGQLAMLDLLASESKAAPGGSRAPISPDAKAKSVIFLFMGGGPSHIDSFDPKPELTRLDGQETPESIRALFKRSATMGNGTRKLMASPFKFKKYGECGAPVSELFTHTAEHIDKLCILRSIQHDTVIHVPSQYLLTTGSIVGSRPSLGAWVLYGMGSESRDLPGFVVFGKPPRPTFASGFLPARYQATKIGAGGEPIPNLRSPQGVSRDDRREQLALINQLNQRHLDQLGAADQELEARIRSYELAFRMQVAAPEAFALNRETEETRRLYGIGEKATDEVGTQCLMARRLVERGVRFIQIHVDGWDSHEDLVGGHKSAALKTDRPIAGLLADLERRGLLDSTLLVWGGEFGRTPGVEKKGGRDHSPGGFTMWMAGGGVRGGHTVGQTDPVGYTAIEKPIHPNSLHATILHALGVDQLEVTYPHNGRQEIPTFLPSEVVEEAFS